MKGTAMKKALVTGASRGIGKEIAKRLAKSGFCVYINYVNDEKKAIETKAEIESAGGKCMLAQADLKQGDCAEKLYEKTGDVDVLVLNASIQIRKKWNEITQEEFDAQMSCNFKSALFLIQKYAKKMCENKWGRIITIGSVQERKPHPDMLVYSSTKAALTLMAQSLSLQFAKNGVTVNSVAPGVIYTDRNTEALADESYAQEIVSKIPSGFWGEPSDCAGIVDFLCAEEARYITGQNIFVDGGMGIK